MIDAGRLTLALQCRAGRVSAVMVANSRPAAARVLVGRSPTEAVALAGTLFSLCRAAQRTAARLAVDAAAGLPRAADAAEVRELRVEVAREHLWRLMLDWPEALGHASMRARFAALHRGLGAVGADGIATAQHVERLVAEAGLGDGPRGGLDAWLAECRAAGDWGRLLAQLAAAEQPEVADARLVPMRTAAWWATGLAGRMPHAAFCSRPVLAQGAAETGALARRRNHPAVSALWAAGRRVAARFAARIVELGEMAAHLQADRPGVAPADGAEIAPGMGLARVETARGVLLHALRVEGGRIAEYAVVAPTEWNFHPAGAFPGEAVGGAVGHARWLALALDPCVSWEVVVEEVADA